MAAGGIAAGAHALILAAAPGGPCSPPPKAPPPEFCLAAAAQDSQVQLTWTPPASGHFVIYDGTVPDIHEALKVRPITGSAASVAGLINGTTYDFWLLDNKSTVVSNMASPSR
jgi:hypothetical protein